EHLPQITDQAAMSSLISSPHELAECLLVGSDWPMEDKANLVMAYIQGKPYDDQEAVLNVLDDEAPQLTRTLKRHTSLQSLYFQIAVQKQDIDAIKSHIEQGADINAALSVLLSEANKRETLYWLYEHKQLIQNIKPESLQYEIPDGKYQGKTL